MAKARVQAQASLAAKRQKTWYRIYYIDHELLNPPGNLAFSPPRQYQATFLSSACVCVCVCVYISVEES